MAKTLIVEIVGDASSLDRAFKSAAASANTFGGKMQNIGSQMTHVGKRLTLGVTTPIVAAGVASFKMATDFETSMNRVSGLAGQSEKDVGRWSKQLLKLGPQLGRGPRELAEALYFVASSGVPASKAMNVVTVSAKAATAGLGDTQQVADAVTSVMNAYGPAVISAAEATDVLVATVREGKGEASEFAPVIGNVVAVASQLKVGFNDVGAALAGMTRLGTDAATASAQLQAFFSAVLKPSIGAEKALGKVGLSFADLRKQLSEQGLIATLNTLKAAFKGNTDQMAQAFPNVRALRGILGLVGNQADATRQIFKRMGDTTGTLAKAFEESQKRTGFTMEKFRASIEAAGIAIGTILAPVVERIATALTNLSIQFQNLDPSIQQIIITMAAVAAVVGPVLIVVGSLVTAIGALAPVFLALVSPVGLVVVALVAIVAAMAAAVLWPDKLKAALERLGVSEKDAATIVHTLRAAFETIKPVLMVLMEAMRGLATVVRGVANIILGILQGDFSRVWVGVKQVWSGAIQFLIAEFVKLPGVLLGIALRASEAILRGIGNGLKKLPAAVRAGFAALPGILASVASEAGSLAVQIGSAITAGIVRGMGSLYASVKSRIISGVQSAIDAAMGIFGNSPQEVIGVALIYGIVRGWNANTVKLKDSIVTKVNEAIDAAQQAVLDKQGVFTSAFDELSSNAISAFDRVTENFRTKTEKKIADEDARRAAKQRNDALSEARAAERAARDAVNTAAAKEGETPEEFAARQAELTKALTAAVQQRADAEFAIQRAKDEKKAAQERRSFENSRELQKRHLDEQLQNLEAQLARGKITVQEFRRGVLAIFDKFDVPFRNAGHALGAALNEALHESFGDAAVAARRLIEAIAREARKIQIVLDVNVRPTSAPGRASGGPVRRGSPYVVGERGPELFVPQTSGRIIANASSGVAFAGGGVAEIIVPVYLGPDKITEVVRREMLRFEKRNGRSAV